MAIDFDALMMRVNRSLITYFPSTATFNPAAGGGPITVNGILSDPPMVEGVPVSGGSVVAQFFLNAADVDPIPQNGDSFTIDGNTYDVADEPEFDAASGITLKLRRNA